MHLITFLSNWYHTLLPPDSLPVGKRSGYMRLVSAFCQRDPAIPLSMEFNVSVNSSDKDVCPSLLHSKLIFSDMIPCFLTVVH